MRYDYLRYAFGGVVVENLFGRDGVLLVSLWGRLALDAMFHVSGRGMGVVRGLLV